MEWKKMLASTVVVIHLIYKTYYYLIDVVHYYVSVIMNACNVM